EWSTRPVWAQPSYASRWRRLQSDMQSRRRKKASRKMDSERKKALLSALLENHSGLRTLLAGTQNAIGANIGNHGTRSVRRGTPASVGVAALAIRSVGGASWGMPLVTLNTTLEPSEPPVFPETPSIW